ncbi:glycoside hydrolase family 1 protein [Lactiplantibacillus mudanjiangensis]|uniref:Beta-glucosidase [Lactobacillus plantarum JDM1] n=1 Tax=Lactiplantibacillus mudanjiangensis TaxID=1296538 RepID=A0A660EBK4_9LACO|nr:glycoside hydrolase family 1 protein [Lactiplantibacillus mudanjiangensis]VDG20130.1 beta-glucosidase [Lactobacillus plantarum JDM1] [Lactiplantibacillus mudanjiangensis]VDG23825.1 beta-glucosidase [Lactobacillus plantarum JDM1] [Lactiplantibacillus mudanjiangensis]VDG30355.1 beta-glucosidase [Lactobacillus plantarum JDM1] [Lactiplantibacillus mudanjiangensis]VDG33523.1 beta-glucosidase [Lactobacillus plantarum JDM1] [Lactiplantibacillus mudanjiangensis]
MPTFPTNFVWGAATSGPQTEGNFQKPHQNVFDYWFATEPMAFDSGVGPDVASDFYHDYASDLALMAQAGIHGLRTSIQWTRLIDDFETASLNPVGVAYYNHVIDAMLAQGIEPYMNLHHFDLPVELYQKYGGWESKHVVELFVKFAEQCFKLFGDRVKNWYTFNEPKVVVDGQYLYGWHYPQVIDGPKAVQVAYNMNLASAKTIAAFRQCCPQDDHKIGIILNLTPAYAASDDPADVAAAEFAELWSNNLFLDPAVLGHFPAKLVETLDRDGVLWEATPDELALIQANTVDCLGVNYYHPFRVQRPDISPQSLQPWLPDIYFKEYDMPGRIMNVDRGWEIYPEALTDIAKNIQENYHNIPWFVSENGMGVANEERFLDEQGVVQDDYRIDFMRHHLQALAKGIAAGSNCQGYFVWTAIDCWSWNHAYHNRYGLIRDELHTQTKTLKKSAAWFNQLSQTNQFD